MSEYRTELLLGALYVALGPGAWAAFGFAMIKCRKRMRLLMRPCPAVPAPPPRVTVLVPAKDEQERIEACLRSVLAQDYPNFDVVVIDDRSADDTAAIVARIASSDPRVHVVHVGPGELPPGWGGKNHALHRGVAMARAGSSAWLLFVDADVQLEPDALRSAMAVAMLREFDMVSLLPRFVGRGFWEELLPPLAGAATCAMFAVVYTNTDFMPTAFANGQFMLVRRAAYEAIGGHEAVRGTLSEDTAIARNLKRARFRPRVGWGDAYASVRMYDSLASTVRGWARNFFIGSRGWPWRILLAIAFVVLCCFSCYASIAWGIYRNAHPLISIGGWGWIASGAAHWLLMTLMLALVYAWSGPRPWHALLFPLGASILLAIFVRSLVTCATGKVEWRGTSYTRATLRAT